MRILSAASSFAHPRSLPLLALACALGCVHAPLAGCSVMKQANAEASVAASATVSEAPSVSAETANGFIEVRKGGEQLTVQALIRATTQARADAVAVNTVTTDDGSVRITLDWPGGKRESNEGASLVITLPEASSLELRSSNGRIEVGPGFAASQAMLVSSNGAILVSDFAGKVFADTSNGRIELLDVNGANADTSNGAINVVLRDSAKGPVTLDTSNGAISLTFGSSLEGTIDLDTSNGSISVQAPRATSVSLDRSSGKVVLSAGGTSVLDTSNGSITVKQR